MNTPFYNSSIDRSEFSCREIENKSFTQEVIAAPVTIMVTEAAIALTTIIIKAIITIAITVTAIVTTITVTITITITDTATQMVTIEEAINPSVRHSSHRVALITKAITTEGMVVIEVIEVMAVESMACIKGTMNHAAEAIAIIINTTHTDV